jgi:hypothetical protein
MFTSFLTALAEEALESHIVGGTPDEAVVTLKDMEDWKPIKVKHFVILDEDKPYTLLVPKNFYSRVLAESLISYNLNVKPIESKAILPRCIFDLKTNINSRLVIDPTDLSNKVMSLNKIMTKYLKKR